MLDVALVRSSRVLVPEEQQQVLVVLIQRPDADPCRPPLDDLVRPKDIFMQP